MGINVTETFPIPKQNNNNKTWFNSSGLPKLFLPFFGEDFYPLTQAAMFHTA